VTDLEEIGGFGGKADRLAQYQTYFGTPDKFDEDLARYEAVTIESMKGAVSRYLDTDSRLIVQFVPEKAERSKAADPDRTKAPDLGTDREFQVPEVKGSKLENGLDLYVVEQHELPKVSVRLVVRAGAVDDPPEFPGLANLVLRTIDKGTSTMKALALEDAFADLGTSLSAVAGNEGSNLTVDVLVDGLEKTVDLLAQVASGAIFPDEELERERKKVLDDIAQQEEDPVRLAQRILPGLLFGPAHPYGHPRDGSTRSLPMIKAPRLREFHSSFFKASNAALVFVGDVTQERAAELAQKFFGSLEKGSPNDRTIPDPQPAPSKAIHFVNQPGAAQSVISLAVPGIRRKADDYYAVELANAILGGMFTSRLNMNLREDKGYTYGAFSSSVSRAKAGMWSAGASVQTKATKESMVEFIAEFEGLGGKRPVTEEELASAKDNKIRGYSQSFSTLARISAQIANIWVWTLPMSTLQEEPATLRSTGLDAVNQAGQARVMLENTRYLVVGDESVVLEGLESLSIGPTIKLDRQGEVLKN